MSTGGCASWSKWCTPTKVCLINDVTVLLINLGAGAGGLLLLAIHLQTQATTALWRCLVAAVTGVVTRICQSSEARHTHLLFLSLLLKFRMHIPRQQLIARRTVLVDYNPYLVSSSPRTHGSRATPPLAMFSTQPVGERHDLIIDKAGTLSSTPLTEVRACALSERPSLQGLGSDSDSNFISTDSFHLSAGHPLLRPTHLLVSTLLNLVNTSSGPPSSAVSVHIATTEPRAKSTSI
ncbi:hypothetical protein P692DRAFT_20284840 [Suillus brevipes Sb2]|nr:hypothetical protein P692DRAFT_20284840 [Suillus brevipes Sb2]